MSSDHCLSSAGSTGSSIPLGAEAVRYNASHSQRPSSSRKLFVNNNEDTRCSLVSVYITLSGNLPVWRNSMSYRWQVETPFWVPYPSASRNHSELGAVSNHSEHAEENSADAVSERSKSAGNVTAKSDRWLLHGMAFAFQLKVGNSWVFYECIAQGRSGFRSDNISEFERRDWKCDHSIPTVLKSWHAIERYIDYYYA